MCNTTSLAPPFTTQLPPIATIRTLSTKKLKAARFPSIKLDGIYKPILRQFRRAMRNEFDQCNQNDQCYTSWDTSHYLSRIHIFMKSDLKLPNVLLDDAN